MNKLCIQCNKTYIKKEGFYKASGNAFQTYCKKCHNENRFKYKFGKINKSKKNIKKYKFEYLPIEIQKKISYELFLKCPKTTIFNRYKKYGILSYSQFTYWNRKKIIPKYIEKKLT